MITATLNVQKVLSLKMVNVKVVKQNANHVMMVKSVHYVKTQIKVYSKEHVLINVQKATAKTILPPNACSSTVISHVLNVDSMKTSVGNVLMANTRSN